MSRCFGSPSFSQRSVLLVWLMAMSVFLASQDRASSSNVAASGSVIGMVIDAQGAWCDQSSDRCRDLFKMYPVGQGSKLVAKPPITKPRTVTIRFRSGLKETFDCSKPRELGCRRPLDLSRFTTPEQNKGVIGAFLDAVMELAGTEPKVYDSLRQGILQARGVVKLSDGVAEKKPQGLNVEAILASLPPGQYLLELCPLDEAGRPACRENSDPVDYAWDPAKPSLYPDPQVRRGMYRMYRWDNTAGVPRRSREYAAVLVAAEGSYSTLSQKFQRVVATTRSWDADDATAPTLRRAYLYTLAQQ